MGAGTEMVVAQAADSQSKIAPGILAAGIVAGFKEGADAVARRDTKRMAAWHAFSILLGAGISAAAWRR